MLLSGGVTAAEGMRKWVRRRILFLCRLRLEVLSEHFAVRQITMVELRCAGL